MIFAQEVCDFLSHSGPTSLPDIRSHFEKVANPPIERVTVIKILAALVLHGVIVVRAFQRQGFPVKMLYEVFFMKQRLIVLV